MNEYWLLWGIVFGSAGLALFTYGKKQKTFIPLICGIILMVFPYFIVNTILLVAIGIALCALPFILKF